MAPADSIHHVLSANLAYHLKRRGLTQTQVAERAGLTQRTIANYLHPALRTAPGKAAIAGGRLSELERLARALGMATWQLLQPGPDRGGR